MASETLTAKAEQIAKQKIHPIVEFFPVDWLHESRGHFLDTDQPDRVILRKHLAVTKGIYSFYNTELEIIYLGKTRSNLWIEMKNAYGREMDHYRRFKVSHPNHKYKPANNNLVRPIRQSKVIVADAAAYFSAYAIEDDELIDIVELMLIRMLPNDLLNKRMEGKMTLQSFASTLRDG